MKLTIEMNIQSILFGVEENVIGNLNIGNDYEVIKDSLTNEMLWKEFDYTTFGLRRIYETAKLNDELDVAILKKSKTITIENAEYTEDESYKIKGKNLEDYIYKLENLEMQYIDKKMRLIRLSQENGFNIKEILINTSIIDQTGRKFIPFNSKIPFPDRIIGNLKKLDLDSKEKIEEINTFIVINDLEFPDSKFNSKLLSTACFLYDQTYTATLLTLKFMVGVIGLESLLVDGKAELSYRLSRNCAMLLSSNAEEYYNIFSKMKKIYDKRSAYVHNGIIKNLDEQDVVCVRNILREVIFKILELNISQQELIKKLDLKGYVE